MLKLNLGCGNVRLEGFTNIDCNPAYEPDQLCLVQDLHYQEDSVDEIVAYDIIEHFDRNEFPKVLNHWFKLLKKDGVLHLRTPDIDRLVRLYAINLFCQIPSNMTADRLAWHLFSEHEIDKMGHKWIFNKESMATALSIAGFQWMEFRSDKEMSGGLYPFAFGDDNTNFYVMAKKKEVTII